jgi:hypothetical protein
VWLFDGMLALLGGLLLISVATAATLALTIWAIVDAFHHPEVAWRRSGLSRPLWVALLIGGWLMTGVLGLVLALVYLATVRPRLVAAARPGPRPRRVIAAPEQPRPGLRVGDADRDRAGVWLQHHYSVGRLSYDELLQRLDQAYAARTVADLQQALRELPQW